MKEKILNTSKYVIGVIMALLLIIFQNKLFYAALDILIGMFLYGIIYILEHNRKGILALLISISTLFSIIIYKAKILSFNDSFTLFVSLNIFLMVDASYIISRIETKKNIKKYSKIVTGTVSDLEQAPNTKKKYICPIYDYEVGKHKYSVAYPAYLNKSIPKIGDEVKIYVNPEDEMDVYFDITKRNFIQMIVSTIIINIVCIIIMLGLFI